VGWLQSWSKALLQNWLCTQTRHRRPRRQLQATTTGSVRWVAIHLDHPSPISWMFQIIFLLQVTHLFPGATIEEANPPKLKNSIDRNAADYVACLFGSTMIQELHSSAGRFSPKRTLRCCC
jgi:hypothetical protein